MPIKRTVKYVCDGCGREINTWREKYETMFIESHGYANLMHDEWDYTYVYCNDCVRHMWIAVRAIPRIRELSGSDGNGAILITKYEGAD